jgi:uncharacterized protein (TIRG00374 family)
LIKKYSVLFFFLSLIPIIWIFFKIDYHKLYGLIVSLPMWIFGFLALTTLLSVLVQVWRVWILTKVYVPEIKYSELLSFHMISSFYTIFLPAASQDIIRSTLLSKLRKGSASYIWGATLLSRFAGLITLLLFSINGLFILDKSTLPAYTIHSIIIFSIITVILAFLSFSKTVTRPIRQISEKVIPKKIFQIILNFRDGVYVYKKHKLVLIQFFFVSLLLQLIFIFASVMIIMSISGKFYLIEVLAFAPLIEIITSAAVFTPQGIGVREILLVFLFKYLHLSTEALGVYILLIYTFSIVSRLFGIFPLCKNVFFSKSPPKKTTTANRIKDEQS